MTSRMMLRKFVVVKRGRGAKSRNGFEWRTAKIPEPIMAAIDKEAKRRKVTAHEIIRTALVDHLSRKRR